MKGYYGILKLQVKKMTVTHEFPNIMSRIILINLL